MRLTMYNAGFGDCFLLSEENDSLLVDFGSWNAASWFWGVVLDVRYRLAHTRGRKAGMLTHYHLDHYKFFKELGEKVFDVFYLPFIYFNKGNHSCALAEEAPL